MKRLLRLLALLLLIALALPVLLVALYAVVLPPLTPLMALRWFGGAEIRKTWTPLARVAPVVQRAVIASEDNLFCEHAGFDWRAVGDAAEDYAAGKRVRGAGTISETASACLRLHQLSEVLDVPASCFVGESVLPWRLAS